MRCDDCPAFIQTSDSYETPEYICQLKMDEKYGETFNDGRDGCRLPLKSINKKVKEIEGYYENLKASW